MNENSENISHLSLFPTEILLNIFTRLPAKHLTKCRQVCCRWKDIVDSLTRDESLWRDFCKVDYKDNYETARYNSRPGMLWYDIYRSLSLWPRLKDAKEVRDEFASASGSNDRVYGFQILKDGKIGVRTGGSIDYYDLYTFEKLKRRTITGYYFKYEENDDYVLLMGYPNHAHVIRKDFTSTSSYETMITYHDVKLFKLTEERVYYVTSRDEIFLCNLRENDSCIATFIKKCDEDVLALGYSDKFYLLTKKKNIYSVNDCDLVLECALGANMNIMDQLRKHGLSEQMPWGIYIEWMRMWDHNFPYGVLQNIINIRFYGNVCLVGSNWGAFRIYYAPYAAGELDLFSSVPVKEYKFLDRFDQPLILNRPILGADVLEADHGHTVLVAIPDKIIVLYFIHPSKIFSTNALLP